jgi:ABC-type lipoprotein release transport system permease subunit
VPPSDLSVMAAVTTALLLAAALAAWIPARRATAIQPSAALRGD